MTVLGKILVFVNLGAIAMAIVQASTLSGAWGVLVEMSAIVQPIVIFTLLRDVSRLPQVYAGYQRLSAIGIRMLGIVVNGAGSESYGSSYSDYYYVEPAAAE